MTITIEIKKEDLEAILKINERYYFDLFKSIRATEEEEHEFRNAIANISKELMNKK